ncbi:MAG: hypothetical protein ACKV2V_01150 [Blastocatellia bacterium]
MHLIPREKEQANDLLRYAEARVSGGGQFELTNLAPGSYYALALPAPREKSGAKTVAPAAWDDAARAKLRAQAEATNVVIEPGLCQRMVEQKVVYVSR